MPALEANAVYGPVPFHNLNRGSALLGDRGRRLLCLRNAGKQKKKTEQGPALHIDMLYTAASGLLLYVSARNETARLIQMKVGNLS
jgi:hypothetical protein